MLDLRHHQLHSDQEVTENDLRGRECGRRQEKDLASAGAVRAHLFRERKIFKLGHEESMLVFVLVMRNSRQR